MILQFQGKLVGVPDVDNAVIGVNEPTPPPPPPTDWTRVPARASLTENTFLTLTTGFLPLYDALGDDDILIILVRHSERPSGTGWNVELTEQGKLWATEFGTALRNAKVTSTNIQCYCTKDGEHQIVRTAQTAFYIAKGMGDSTLSDYTQVNSEDLKTFISGEYFKRDWRGTGYATMGKYVSYPVQLDRDQCTAFRISYDNRETEAPAAITSDAENALCPQNHLLDVCSSVSNKKIFVVSSHDMYVVPFVSWISRFNLSPHKYEWNDSGYGSGYWSDYMSGGAIIAHKSSKTFEVVPIAGHGDGYKYSGWN